MRALVPACVDLELVNLVAMFLRKTSGVRNGKPEVTSL